MTSSSRTDHADRIRVRRRARALLATAGVFTVISAITPPLAARVRFLDGLLPLSARESAAATAAVSGVLLVILAGGLRRGHRRAWLAALGLLAVSMFANIFKGLDVEEAATAGALAIYLGVHHRAFAVPTDRGTTRRLARASLAGVIGACAAGVVALAVAAGRDRPLGVHGLAVWLGRAPSRVMSFIATSGDWRVVVTFVVIGAAGWTTWVLLRPSRASGNEHTDLDRARNIVSRHGSGTLDYFALRDDKQHWFHHDTVVAYRVLNGVCLVSPDPVGPPHEREAAWTAFRVFAESHGWSSAVLGATADWVEVYRHVGMRAVYLGDEAIVDVAGFQLAGGRFKGLRQAVSRISRNGYTMELTDPTIVDAATRGQLIELASQSRHGDSERGFSMTLGRLFDPADLGLLLAIVRAPDATPVAFCQFVPAPAIGGYSLDLMRRSTADHPNGLLDFLLVSTIVALAERGTQHLSLNFAAMRSVVADETSTGWAKRYQRKLLCRLSRSLQIESLWRFNAKYEPIWTPRYVLVDASDQIGPVGLAAIRAEQALRDLPVIGLLLALGQTARSVTPVP